MADYHFVYKDVEGRSTEWDDIQRRLGNLPPKPEPFKPPPFAPKVDADRQPKSKEWLDEREPEELEELEDDLDDDRFLEQYRKMRLAELREAAKAARFGSIVPITGSDFVREVSQAPSDVWVAVFLYKDGVHARKSTSELRPFLATFGALCVALHHHVWKLSCPDGASACRQWTKPGGRRLRLT